MKRVIIISPYSGETEEEIKKNVAYAEICMLDSLNRDEAPFLSHLLYTRVLDDKNPNERKLGIKSDHEWFYCADYCVVYEDLGISEGIKEDIKQADKCCIQIQYRKLYVK